MNYQTEAIQCYSCSDCANATRASWNIIQTVQRDDKCIVNFHENRRSKMLNFLFLSRKPLFLQQRMVSNWSIVVRHHIAQAIQVDTPQLFAVILIYVTPNKENKLIWWLTSSSDKRICNLECMRNMCWLN